MGKEKKSMNSTLEINEWTSAIGYKGEEIHIGDWVMTEWYKGYYKIIGFGADYGTVDRPSVNIKRGEFIGVFVKLEKVFTATMKLRLGIEAIAAGWVHKVSDEKRNEIETFWKEHPKEYEKYTKFVVGEELGNEWWDFSWYPDEVEYWKEEVLKNPKRFTYEQFVSWLRKTGTACDKFFEGKKLRGKKSQYYVTIDLIEEGIELGKTPMFYNPRILFGK